MRQAFLSAIVFLLFIACKDSAPEIRRCIITERELEGVWIVLPMKCGNKFISFAYLRRNEKLMLGDTDAEMQQ